MITRHALTLCNYVTYVLPHNRLNVASHHCVSKPLKSWPLLTATPPCRIHPVQKSHSRPEGVKVAAETEQGQRQICGCRLLLTFMLHNLIRYEDILRQEHMPTNGRAPFHFKVFDSSVSAWQDQTFLVFTERHWFYFTGFIKFKNRGQRSYCAGFM